MEELAGLNSRILHQLPYEAVADRLPGEMTAEAWEAIRPNLHRVAEAADWWHVVEGPIEQRTPEEDRDFLRSAAEAAERIDWSDGPWAALTGALKQSSGRNGKSLFLPLRKALTGRDSGPEMAPLLVLIGKERSVQRLKEGAGL
jgi:glutamyl-tRNA synthetase